VPVADPAIDCTPVVLCADVDLSSFGSAIAIDRLCSSGSAIATIFTGHSTPCDRSLVEVVGVGRSIWMALLMLDAAGDTGLWLFLVEMEVAAVAFHSCGLQPHISFLSAPLALVVVEAGTSCRLASSPGRCSSRWIEQWESLLWSSPHHRAVASIE
jgi:uncharacterized membrane protein